LPQLQLDSFNTTLVTRAIEVRNLPGTSPECKNTITGVDAATYGKGEIQDAITVAADAILTKIQYQKNGKGAPYPHTNTPGSASSSQDSYADYNLPDCAQANTDANGKRGFVEHPILRNKKTWVGGSEDQGPDRVLFQFVTDGDESVVWGPGFTKLVGNFKYAAYCGTVNHVVRNDQFLGGFAPCTNSKG
jgi:hypothetical protein